jgi:hypothetical protein
MKAYHLPDVCLIGAAGAGKTTAAELLVKDYGYTRLSFAEPLKVMLDTQTDRRRLQEFGTDVVRAYEPDAWVRLFLWGKRLRLESWEAGSFTGQAGPFVVDDARFENEIAQLIQDDFVIARVAASLDTRIERLRANGKYVEGMFEHASEKELAHYQTEHLILNDTAWSDDLAEQVEAFVNAIRS